MNNQNQSVIIRLAFKRGSNRIHVGFTSNENITLTGEIIWSSDLEVNTYQSINTLYSENAIGKVAITCIEDEDFAESIINQINSIQEARPINIRGNKYPFVFIKVVITDDVIFNPALRPEEKDRLTLLNVEHIEVYENAPEEVFNVNRQIRNNQQSNTISWYERRNKKNNSNNRPRAGQEMASTMNKESRNAAHSIHRNAAPSTHDVRRNGGYRSYIPF